MNRLDKQPPPEIAPSIDLGLRQKLRNDREYRKQLFWTETSAGIARDLVKLRKRRGHSQKKLADLTGTKQPAISRIEQADYDGWNLSTLRAIADVEDARIRVTIVPAEDVLAEYDAPEHQASVYETDIKVAGGGMFISITVTTHPDEKTYVNMQRVNSVTITGTTIKFGFDSRVMEITEATEDLIRFIEDYMSLT